MHIVQEIPGVIEYFETGREEINPPLEERPSYRERKPEYRPESKPVPHPQPFEHPVPVIAEPALAEAIAQYLEGIRRLGGDAESEARRFFDQYPEWAWTVLLLGSIGILLLVADDLTAIGIADDWAIPILATFVSVAWEYI